MKQEGVRFYARDTYGTPRERLAKTGVWLLQVPDEAQIGDLVHAERADDRGYKVARLTPRPIDRRFIDEGLEYRMGPPPS